MEQYREKIETYGNFYEKQGFSPVASRVLVYLFLHPDGEATFDEMVQYFKVSKSAISNAIKILLLMDAVTEKTKSGGRKRYFRATIEKMFSPENAIKGYRDARLMFEDLRKLRKKKDDISDELLKATSFIKLLESEYAKLYEEMLKGFHSKK
jgi:DNA-binding transcriptional regulator GbsR (MarR family)